MRTTLDIDEDGDCQVCLSSVIALAAICVEQERAARNSLRPCFRIGQAHKPAPPVIDDRHILGGNLIPILQERARALKELPLADSRIKRDLTIFFDESSLIPAPSQ